MATQEEITFGNYEVTLLISPETQEMDVQKLVTKLQNQIAQKGGRIFATNLWGKQRLAYPIGKFEFGHYANLVFSYPSAQMSDFSHDIKLAPETIRHLIISLDKEGVKPETMRQFDPFKEQAMSSRTTAEGRSTSPASPLRTRKTSTIGRSASTIEKPKASDKDEATRLKELEEKLGKLLEEE